MWLLGSFSGVPSAWPQLSSPAIPLSNTGVRLLTFQTLTVTCQGDPHGNTWGKPGMYACKSVCICSASTYNFIQGLVLICCTLVNPIAQSWRSALFRMFSQFVGVACILCDSWKLITLYLHGIAIHIHWLNVISYITLVMWYRPFLCCEAGWGSDTSLD